MNAQLRELLTRIPCSPETDELQDLCEKLERELAEAHAVLDADPSKIIRNHSEGFPEGREPHELTLAERVQALCKYAADWKHWFFAVEQSLTDERDQLQKDLDHQREVARELHLALERLLAFSQHGFSPVEKAAAEEQARQALAQPH
jgi:hypothetical protein